MTQNIQTIWVYLAATPLFALALTLVVYQGGQWLYSRSRYNPLANPVLFSVAVIVALLASANVEYSTYFDGAQFVHFLLGPATVALAVPLYQEIQRIRKSLLALFVALLAGSTTAAVTAVGIGWLLGASTKTLVSLAPKSATTPVAMGVTEQLAGYPSLTAVAVIVTGIIGAVAGTGLLRAFRIDDEEAVGVALGVASHGIGTARALELNSITGAFAGLAMGLNALATALLVPLLLHWVL